MDGSRVGPTSQGIPASGVDLRHHLQVQREQTAWRTVQVSDVEVPHQDIRHPPPMIHKDHQQQTILWSNAAGMSGPVSMPSMQPNMPPPTHMMTSNMPPHLMQGPNMPHLTPSMSHMPQPPPPSHNMSSLVNVSQSVHQQGMTLVHTSQADHMHGFQREAIPVAVHRNHDDPIGMGNGDPADGMVDIQINPPPPQQPPVAAKKDKPPKGVKKPRKPKEKKVTAVHHTCGKNGPPVERKIQKPKVCECERCGKGFVSWQNMKIHYTNVHKEEAQVEKQYNTKCPYEGCGRSFFHRKTMLKHLSQDHGVKTEQEHFEFENMEGFLDWKEKTETENHVYFVKQRGLRFHKGWYDQHFYCQRDGSARAHVKKGQPDRKTNRRAKKGVTKTGIACPAKMSVKYQKGEKKVSVLYTKTHSHPINILDTQFHPISKRTIAQLSETFARGVPVIQVHHEINNVVKKLLDTDSNSSQSQEIPKEDENKEKDIEGEKEQEEQSENVEKEKEQETEKENEKEKEKISPKRNLRKRESETQPDVFIPPVVRILNKRQLHAIKVQADTARIRDACQKLVSVLERSARVRKKLLTHATRTVEDMLEECISVALMPTNSPGKKTSLNSKKRGPKGKMDKKAAKRQKLFHEVIQEVAEQELIPTAINEVEVEHVHETLVEDMDDNVMETVESESYAQKDQMEEETRIAADGIPAEEQTVEIPLTNHPESRVHLQEALPEEESCVVTLLAQMEGQTAVEFNYKEKETNEQHGDGVRSFDGIGSDNDATQTHYQVLITETSANNQNQE